MRGEGLVLWDEGGGRGREGREGKRGEGGLCTKSVIGGHYHELTVYLWTW